MPTSRGSCSASPLAAAFGRQEALSVTSSYSGRQTPSVTAGIPSMFHTFILSLRFVKALSAAFSAASFSWCGHVSAGVTGDAPVQHRTDGRLSQAAARPHLRRL